MTQRCRILVTGASGQDARVLFALMRNSGLKADVFGVSRGSHQVTEALFSEFGGASFSLKLVQCDYGEGFSSLLKDIAPDLVFHFGASTFVEDSWKDTKLFHAQMLDPVIDILEYCRTHSDCRVFLASSSEIFGDASVSPQNEQTCRATRNPYGQAKVTVLEVSRMYRKRYSLFVVNGIFYNHESYYRGDRFVTMKICKGFKEYIKSGQSFSLGNIEACRDWSSAWDFMRGSYYAVRHETPSDYVFSSGTSHSIKDWINVCAEEMSLNTRWQGEGLYEHLVDAQSGNTIISIDPSYYRPADSQLLMGDSSWAQSELHWQNRLTFRDIILEMLSDAPPPPVSSGLRVF